MAKKILIADDDKGIVKTVALRLNANGYEVLTAHDGEAALEAARRERPDLIILDVLMPKLNGAAVCGILKYDRELQTIPIMMLTVKNRAIDKEVGTTLKADAFMTKPFDGNELVEKIQNLLGEEKTNEEDHPKQRP